MTSNSMFDMAAGMAKLEITNLMVSTARSSMEGLENVTLNEDDQKQLKKLLTLAAAGATFQI